jgi:hypothetical protein
VGGYVSPGYTIGEESVSAAEVPGARAVVEQWLRANDDGAVEQARPLFADGLVVEDPMDTLHGADAFIGAMSQLYATGFLRGLKDVELVADGEQVAAFLVMDTPAGAIRAAHRYTVHSGQIVALRVYFDPRPLIPA